MHLQTLSAKSRKNMRRAIAMSGVAFSPFANYKENNHIELLKELFDLDKNWTGSKVLNFMKTAPADQIVQKAPVITLDRGLAELYWTAVIEGFQLPAFTFTYL